MGTDPPARSAGAKERLLGEIRRTLHGGMGMRTPWRPRIIRRKPAAIVTFWLLLYAAVWGVAEIVAWFLGIAREPRLISLLIWGAFYAAATIIPARAANLRVLDTVEHDIIPHASEAYLAAVADDLAQRFDRASYDRMSMLIGAAALTLGLLAISRDIDTSDGIPIHELLLWAVSYFYYFVTAARTVRATRFYLSFSRCLEREPPSLYVMAAAQTPLIRGLARLGGVPLRFWTWIFLSVVSIMLLAVLPLGAYRFDLNSKFLFVLIPLASCF
jgi:hypothetical protein